jgi:C1A family cysteine protease
MVTEIHSLVGSDGTVDSSSIKAMMYALQHSPVATRVDASSLMFSNYRGGIINAKDCYSDVLNHSITIVGYGYTSSFSTNAGYAEPYWIAINSWGADWGEEGIVKFLAVEGEGICGV